MGRALRLATMGVPVGGGGSVPVFLSQNAMGVSWTETDTGNKLTIGANVAITGAVTAWTDPRLISPEQARIAGLALFLDVQVANTNARPIVGWSNATTGGPTAAVDALAFWSDGFIGYWDGAWLRALVPYVVATDYSLAFVQMSAGCQILIKGGTFSEWTRLFISRTQTAVMYGSLRASDSAVNSYYDNDALVLMPSPFNTAGGGATQALTGAQAEGQAFSHEANCLIEFTLTTRPSADSVLIDFRVQDDDNKWQIAINSTGDIALNEVVSGSVTAQGTAAAKITNGERVVVTADGPVICVYDSTARLISYDSATNFQTSTSGTLKSLGTGGAITGIVTWPRVLSGNALRLFNLVSSIAVVSLFVYNVFVYASSL